MAESSQTNAQAGNAGEKKGPGRRQERVGIVASDRMTKTVVVTVVNLVKHPKYKKIVRRSSRFMAHDDLGCNVGDKVRIVETRPLSRLKRWKVVEVVQAGSK